MASGTISGTTSSQYCICKTEWSSEPNIENNTSIVTAKLYYKRTNSYTTYGEDWAFTIDISGKKTSVSNKSLTIKQDWVLALTATATVEHDDDGSKTIIISATGGNSDTSVSSTSCSGTASLDKIARASSITSASDVTLGNNCNVIWTPKSASFRYKLNFSIGEWSYTTEAIHPNKITAYTYTGYTIPLDVARQLPNAAKGAMTVTLYTYSSSDATTQVGSESSATFTVTVPPSTLPTVYMSLEPVHSLPAAFNGIYVQGLSKVKATITADLQYNASLSYYDFTVEGKTYGAGDAYTSAYLANYGSISVAGHAEDSRGYGGYISQIVNVSPYTTPKVQNVSANRCDAEGNLSDSGTYLKISAKRVYSKVESDGKQRNYCTLRYRYKSIQGVYGSWITLLDGRNTDTDDVTVGPLLDGTLAVDTTYLVQVGVVDDIGNESFATITVPTDTVYCHRDGARRSFTFGGYVEDDKTFSIASDIVFKAKGGIAAISLYDSYDFNVLIYKTGYYTGTSAPGSAGCTNYPINKTGVLEVVSNVYWSVSAAAWFGFAWQTYRTHVGDIYTRSYYSTNGWTEWKKVQMV